MPLEPELEDDELLIVPDGFVVEIGTVAPDELGTADADESVAVVAALGTAVTTALGVGAGPAALTTGAAFELDASLATGTGFCVLF